MLRALLWKSWREHRAMFLGGLAWMTLAALHSLAYECRHACRAAVASFHTSAMLYSWFAAIGLAVQLTQRERRDRTLSFLQSLPVPLRMAAAVRLGMAFTAIVIPVLAAGIIVGIALASGAIEQAAERLPAANYIRLPERESLSVIGALGYLGRVTAIDVASGAQLLVVLSLLGNFLRSDKAVGFVGVVVCFGFMVAGEVAHGTSGWAGAALPAAMSVNWGYGAAGGVHYGDLELVRSVWGPLAVNVVFVGQLAAAFAITFGRGGIRPVVTDGRRRSWWTGRGAAWFRGLVPRVATPAGSLVWLTLRQSLPLALSGLVLAVLLGCLELREYRAEAGYSGVVPRAATLVARNLGATVWFTGMAWAVIVAAGVFSEDLQPRRARFWTARPISPARWFAVRYLAGLAAVLLVLDGSAIVAGWLARPVEIDPRTTSHSTMGWSYVASVPLLHAVLYSLGVAAVVATRNGIKGGAAALAVFTVLMVSFDDVPSWILRDWISVYNDLQTDELAGRFDLARHGYPALLAASMALIIALFVFGQRRLARPVE